MTASVVVVVGSVNVDAVLRVGRLPAAGETVLATGYARLPGGKGANQSVAAARQGASTALIGRVGDDEDGRWLRAALTAEGVDTFRLLATPDMTTGVAHITVNDTGDNVIVVAPLANSALTAADVDRAAPTFAGASVVVAQLETPVATVKRALEVARQHDVTTVLNPSPPSALDPDMLTLVDVLVANEHEATAVGEDACAVQITTLGAAGARLCINGAITEFASFPVDSVDSTAAGDAFCGALAAGLAAGVPVQEAMRPALAAGALACTRRGAISSLPTRDEVAALLR